MDQVFDHAIDADLSDLGAAWVIEENGIPRKAREMFSDAGKF
jgi:hypothetical protein